MSENNGCIECGMANVSTEYHPFVLCLLVKARGGDTTAARRDLAKVMEDARSSPGWLEHRIDTFLANVTKEGRS